MSEPQPAASLNDLVVRPMRREDRPAVEAIAAQVWGGEDYIPYVFDEWLADPAGVFCAATLHGVLIGLSRLAHMGGDQWWMEGLRVDPAYRGLGVGRALHNFMLGRALEHAPGQVRLSTASDNLAVQKLARDTGFRRVAAFEPYGAEADPGQDTRWLVRLGPEHAGAAWARLTTLPHIRAAELTLEESWRFLPLTPDLLKERLAAGQVYAWRANEDSSSPIGLVILNKPRGVDDGEEEEEGRFYVGCADAETPGELRALARALRGMAAAEGFPRVSWKVPASPDLLAELQAAGYEKRWDGQVFLYARDLAPVSDAAQNYESDV